MARFLLKRLLMALGILLAISVFIYAICDLAMDPLDDLRNSTAPNKQQLIDARIQQLHLDQPWFVRYWQWLTHFLGGDLGTAWRSQQPVAKLLGPAIVTSFQLVLTATLLAIIMGVTVGIITALRQYSSFDYAITLVSFVLYSLPVFWVAVLLKQFLAIGLNDYLAHPSPNWVAIAVFSALAGLFWLGAMGGDSRRRVITFTMAFVATFGVLAYVTASGWLEAPSVGVVGMVLIGVAAALGSTAIFAGLRNRRALYSTLTTAAVGIVAYLGVQWLFFFLEANWWMLAALLVLTLGIGAGIGWLYGGPDRAVSMRVAALTGVIMSVFVFSDRIMQAWGAYVAHPDVHGRPIGTIGASTPGMEGDFWLTQMDRFTHLLLPTIALVLIEFASYTRYQRGSMLEVLNQDYIRTARAKGLSERVVIVRHALRNALMPLASIVPVSLVGLVGGAIMTETIFGWSGMGKLFFDALKGSEPDPVMSYVIIVGALAMAANLLADFLYALLDPRIRVNA